MTDEIIDILEAAGWRMTAAGPDISIARGMGCADFRAAFESAMRQAVMKRWRERQP